MQINIILFYIIIKFINSANNIGGQWVELLLCGLSALCRGVGLTQS